MFSKRIFISLLSLAFSFMIIINGSSTLADEANDISHFKTQPNSLSRFATGQLNTITPSSSPDSEKKWVDEELMVIAEIAVETEDSLSSIQEMGYSCKEIGSCLLEIPKRELESIQSAGFITKIHDQAIRVKPIDTTDSSPLAEVYQYGLNGTDYDIPDHNPDTSTCGWIWDTIEITGAPPGSVVTSVNYRIQVNHTFVGDLNIILFNLSPSAVTVWDNWGSDEDSNFDDDPENDPDIYLDRWITSPFDGDLVNQDWSLEIMDCIYFDIGYIDYFELWIYYEESPPYCEIPGTPQLFQPSNGATLNQSRPNFDWGDAQDANEYWIVGTDVDDVYNYFFETVTISEYTPDFDLSDGTYEWLVYSRNTANGCNESVDSDTWGFTIDKKPPPPTLDPIWNPDLDGVYAVSWSSVTGADSYELQEEYSFSNVWTSIYTGGSTSNNFVDKPTGDFCYRVRAKNNSGSSNWSAEECVLVKFGIPPDTPTLYSITNPEFDGSYTVSWSDVSADYYRLEEQQNGGTWIVISNYGTELYYDVTDRPDGTWCYRVMAVKGEGSDWSNTQCTSVVTTLPPLIDSGFRPNPDGYQFRNYGGVHYDDFTIDDMRVMFGDDAVCNMVGSVCQPLSEAIQWNERVNEWMAGGRCTGFTISSLRFFKDIDDPSDYQAGANHTYDILAENGHRHVSYYWAHSVVEPVSSAGLETWHYSPSQILSELQAALSNGAPDPVDLIIYSRDKGVGHSIAPYAIEEKGNGIFWVRVYDNNAPNDSTRHVVINTTNDTWSYGGWEGDATSRTMGFKSISIYSRPVECPWCSSTRSQAAGTQTRPIWLFSQNRLSISDSQGRRIGFLGNEFVDEIPEAYGNFTVGGLGIHMEPIYSLPQNETYSILLSGEAIQDAQLLRTDAVVADEVKVSQIGPGFAVTVEDLKLATTSEDLLNISSDGTQVTYQASVNVEPTIKMGLDGSGVNYEFQIKGADIGAEQIITLTAPLTEERLVFDNSETDGGTYDLRISVLDAMGSHTFNHLDIPVAATDTHFVEYSSWEITDTLTLEVDHGSDGSIDETVTLDNQYYKIYLPINTR